jgi:hypothetical protein
MEMGDGLEIYWIDSLVAQRQKVKGQKVKKSKRQRSKSGRAKQGGGVVV